MDPLSLISGVAGIITLAQSVISGLTTYTMSVKGAPAEMRTLIDELGSLNNVLAEIKSSFEDKANGKLLDEGAMLMKTLAACQQILTETLHKLEDFDIKGTENEGTPSKGVKYKQLLKRMSFPFKRDEVQRLLVVVRDYKATLTLAMTLEGQ